MKRILCALLSALLLLTLTACGGKKPAEDPSVQPPVEQPDTPDTPDPPRARCSAVPTSARPAARRAPI